MNQAARATEDSTAEPAGLTMLLNADGLILWAGPSVRSYQLDSAAILGKPAAELLHGSDAIRFRRGLMQALESPGVPIVLDTLQFHTAGMLQFADDTLTYFPG